jgi:hypothetical protein
MIFITSWNGEGPLEPVPRASLIHQSAKPFRSSVDDTWKFRGGRRKKISNAERPMKFGRVWASRSMDSDEAPIDAHSAQKASYSAPKGFRKVGSS